MVRHIYLGITGYNFSPKIVNCIFLYLKINFVFAHREDPEITHYAHRSDQLSKIFVRKILIIFLPCNLNICFGCSKESSHEDGSYEYQQHIFWLRNKKNNFQVRTLTWGPVCSISSGSSLFTKVPIYALKLQGNARM